jgi:hypothetical protein
VPELWGKNPVEWDQFHRKMSADYHKKILKHCGMWKDTVQRPPPQKESAVIMELSLDYEFFNRVCI